MDSTISTIVICATVFACVASIGSCNRSNETERQKAAQALQAKGVEPLDIPCLIGAGTEHYCLARSAAKKQEGK